MSSRAMIFWCPVLLTAVVLVLAATAGQCRAGEGYVSIKDYLPESRPTDGSVDLRPYIEKALTENMQVFFPGSLDAEQPISYPISASFA